MSAKKISRDAFGFLIKEVKEEVEMVRLPSLGGSPEWECVYLVLKEWYLSGLERFIREKPEYKVQLSPVQLAAFKAVFGGLDLLKRNDRLYALVHSIIYS